MKFKHFKKEWTIACSEWLQEKLLACSNADCKEKIAWKSYDKHVREECEDRVVERPFSKHGNPNKY